VRFAFITTNWTLKVFALLASALLFLFVNVESNTPVDVEVPVEYRTPENIEITSDAPSSLHAILKGPWAAFHGMLSATVEPVVIDLTNYEPGTVRYRIQTTDIKPPAAMQVVSVRPSEVELTLDRRVEKQLPVLADRVGNPAFGYEVVELRVEPQRVRVAGPLAAMQKLEYVYTRPIDLRDKDADFEITVDLRPPGPPVRLLERKSVTVFVDLAEELAQRQLADIPVRLEGAPRGTRVRPEVVSVTLKGPRRLMDELDGGKVEAIVTLDPATLDGQQTFEKIVTLRPELPERTQILGNAPKVEVSVPGKGKRKK
jgi:YbbR domain-containing protein